MTDSNLPVKGYTTMIAFEWFILIINSVLALWNLWIAYTYGSFGNLLVAVFSGVISVLLATTLVKA